MKYEDFLAGKQVTHVPTGTEPKPEEFNRQLFDFQRDIVSWAIRKGRSAMFADCGMGKTAMQLQWAESIGKKTLILAPLAVGKQTVREGEKFGMVIIPSEQGDALPSCQPCPPTSRLVPVFLAVEKIP